MADVPTDDNEFGQELADAFAADEAVETSVDTPEDKTKEPEVEESKKDAPDDAKQTEEEKNSETPPANGEEKPSDGSEKKEDSDAPGAEAQPPVEPQPITKDDITAILRDMQANERNSSKELETTTNEILQAYYPDGLSNVLVDQNTGKELRSPQDVVDASNGELSIEQAQQWLMNEQYKLDQNIAKIKDDATKIAETTVNFKRDSVAVLEKYDGLFKAYPHLQEKAFNLMMKQVKVDEQKGVILSAPDVMELYDTYLDPYRLAYEFSTNKPATNPTTPPETTPPATPGQGDRMDEGGDGGQSPVDDPNDFAQQVSKELAKGI